MSTITWIEDDHRRYGALVELLKKDGHIIITYGSWEEAQEKLETICKTDIIILDIILPSAEDDRYSGLTLLHRLREKCNYQNPVIVCSRVRNPDVHRELMEMGVKEILVKPVKPSDLHAVVTKALG
jgi:DNA-binding response OmpR family regulator